MVPGLVALTFIAMIAGAALGGSLIGFFARVAPTTGAVHRLHIGVILLSTAMLAGALACAVYTPAGALVLGPLCVLVTGAMMRGLDDDDDGRPGLARRLAPHLPPSSDDPLALSKAHVWGLAVENILWIAGLLGPVGMFQVA